ncbi:polymorphic toxin type 24 domain-containing protein [Flavobacterium sp. WV_118_3]|uniref:polymorphic toxin type 24 domain-containing protein n=1 Tax=Flavobacterium sp. WV_118_3 TaxID=3151764 RepID=UPI00321B169F
MLAANALSKVTARISSGFATRSIAKAGSNVGAREIPKVTEQALEISNRIKKNSINIRTPNKTLHFALQGATYKGVSTPHIQQSLPNINPKTGQIFWNKDKQWVRPMPQQDIRIIQNYLKRK